MPRSTRKSKKGRVKATAATAAAAAPAGPSQCHPCQGETTPPQGCLPMQALQVAAAKLGVTAVPQTLMANPRGLRAALEKRVGTPAGTEYSFLRALPLPDAEKRALAKKYLRPPMPDAWRKDPDMWLDSNNIADVLNQYEECYSDFEFMGPFPIDFAAPNPYGGGGGRKECLMKEICDIRLPEEFRKGTRRIGIVYNLDPHYKGGSHWVAAFIDIPKHACYYFDSYGYAPPKQIATFMKWLTTQDPKMKLHYNARKCQEKNTECGVYCIYFISRMLAGDEFREFCRRDPTDGQMLDLRDWFFST